MFFTLLWGLFSAAPVLNLSSDGLSLLFLGEGVIDQDLARSKGNYKNIQNIFINGSFILDEHAFESFSSLKYINLTDDVKEIKSSCFVSCLSLLEFSFPSGVTKINSELFRGCYSLNTIRIGPSINSINNYLLFNGCYSLSYFDVSLDNAILSTDQSHHFLMSKNGSILYSVSNITNQILPSNIEVIHNYCYYGNIIISINFSKSQIRIIKTRSFAQLKISFLEFPSTLERVESLSFYQSTIYSIFLPKSLLYFDKNALAELKLTNLNVEDSQALIKKNGLITDVNETIIFFVDSNISTIILSNRTSFVEKSIVRNHNILNVEANSSYYSSYDGILYSSDRSILEACPGGKLFVTIYSGCKIISSLAFQGCKIERVVVNDGLEEIREQAFLSCSNLTSINFPPSLTSLFANSFGSTVSLHIDVIFGPNLSLLGGSSFYRSGILSMDLSECVLITALPSGIFSSCSIRSIKLPHQMAEFIGSTFQSSSIDFISFSANFSLFGNNCFEKCSLLKNVNLRNTKVKEISDSCFYSSGLQTIELPQSLETISSRAFASCVDLTSIIFPSDSNLTSVSSSNISGCKSLKTFNLPPSVSSVSDGAFSHSYGLVDFEMKSISKYEVIEGILYTNNGQTLVSFPGGRTSARIHKEVSNIQILAFEGCINLESVTFDAESRLKSLPENTFLDCSNLRKIILTGNLRSFDSTAFKGCKEIENISFIGESQLRVIPMDAFNGCNKLVHFEFHSNLESIERSAFEGSSLESVTLFNTKEILERAFSNCIKLKYIKLMSSLSKVSSNAFDGCQNLIEFSYCGEYVDESVQFKESLLDGVFVSTKFEGTHFGTKPVAKLLDDDCLMATGLFTNSSHVCLCEICLFQNIVTNSE